MALATAAIADLESAARDLISMDAVTIPPYPAVAMRLQQVVSSGKYGIYELSKIAMTDTIIAGYLLRAANSAAMRGAQEITAVSDAVARLGAAEVVKIALAVSLGAEATRRGPLAAIRRRAWQESLASAMIAFHLANARGLNGQEAFVSGLLHDVGRVVTVTCIEQLLGKNKDGRSLTMEQWLSIVDRFHLEVGALTAVKWGLSDLLRTVIAFHHHPAKAAAHRPMVDVISSADSVISLLMDKTSISTEMLSSWAGLPPNEAQRLMGVIPGLGGFLASLEDLSTPGTGGTEVMSQILPPATPASSAAAPIDVPLRLIRNTGESDGRIVRLRPSGIDFVCRERLPHNYLARLELRPNSGESRPFDIHVFVERCEQKGQEFEIGGRLFALAGDTKTRWNSLMESIAPAAPRPGMTGAFPAVGAPR